MGIDFDHQRWAAHLEDELTEWFNDYEVAGFAVAAWVSAVTVTVDGVATAVKPLAIGGPYPNLPVGTPNPDLAVAMSDDPFHPGWEAATETIATVAGRWLHPETRWSQDPYALASGQHALLIGCRDLADLDAPRRFDPDLDPLSNDIGVIAFPVTSGSVLEYIESGLTTADAGTAAAVEAIVNAAVHEAFETFPPGSNGVRFTPHAPPLTVDATLQISGAPPTAFFPVSAR